jgi:hypothetical protein
MRTYVRAFAAIACFAALSACEDSRDGGNPTPPIEGPASPTVRFIHAVPDAPDVNIRAGEALLAFELDYRQATPDRTVNAGTASVQVDANLPDGELTVIGPVDVTLEADMKYAVIAVGEVDPAGEPITPLVIANPNEPVTAGNARVEVVHAAPNAPAVDIFVTAPGAPLAGATPIAGGSTPFGAYSGQIEVPASDYQIRVTLPGSTTPVFDSGTVSLTDGADLLIAAMDNTGPGAAPILLHVSTRGEEFEIFDVDTPAEVRVVHAVPDAPAVDVFVNDPTAVGAPAIGALDYTQVAPGPDSYVELPGGTTNVLVTAAGNPGVIAIPATDLELSAGVQYSVYATGTLATTGTSGGIEPYITVDDDRPVATEAKVRILHLSPSAGPVDIYVLPPASPATFDLTGATPAFSGVDFRQETGYVALNGGSYTVAVAAAGTTNVAIGPVTIDVVAGGVYTAAARDPDPDVANDTFGLILLDDF